MLKKRSKFIIYFIVLLVMIGLSVGFSALQKQLTAHDMGAEVRLQKEVRVSNISVSKVSGSAVSNFEDYNKEKLFGSVTLPSTSSYVLYKVDLTNYGNVKSGLLSITNNGSGTSYSICDSNGNNCTTDPETKICNGSNCTLGTTKEIYVKVSSSTTGTKTVDLNLDFEPYNDITYEYFQENTSSFKSEIMSTDSYSVTFTSKPEEVEVTGEATYTYNKNTGVLNLSSISSSLTISAKYLANTMAETSYSGSNPNNYVLFNDTLYRIVTKENVDDGYGNVDLRTKIISHASIGKNVFDTSDKYDDFNKSSIRTLLNTTFYNSLSEDAKSMIDTALFSTTGGSNEESYVGLISGSDVYNGEIINPFLLNYEMFTLTYHSEGNFYSIVNNEYTHSSTGTSLDTHPVLYLKENVLVVDGTGTSTDPYILELSGNGLQTNPTIIQGRTLTVTGSNQELVTVSNKVGTVYYSTSTRLTSENYTSGSTSIPTAKNTGNYTIYYYIPAGENYKPKSGKVETRINGLTYTIAYVKGENITSIGKESDSCTTSGSALTCSVTLPSITPAQGYENGVWKNGSNTYNVGSSFTLNSNNTGVSLTSQVSGKTYVATFYYYNGSGVSTETRSCTVSSGSTCNVTVPSSVQNSTGVYGGTYKGIASATNSMTLTNTTLSESKSLYAVYQTNVTNYYYNTSTYGTRTLYRNEYFSSNSSLSVKLSNSQTGVTNYDTETGPGSSVWTGLSTAQDTTVEYNTIDLAATSTSTTFYTVYTFNIDYEKGANVSAIGATSDSCRVTTDNTSCTVSLPSITPNTGYISVGWSTTNGDTTGEAPASSYTLNTNSVTLYANAVEAYYQNTTSGDYYITLNEAFAAVSNNQTVKVLKDTTETNWITLANTKTGIKLDLNGKTITLTNCIISNKGELDIYNSSSVSSTLKGNDEDIITNDGTLTLNGTSSTNVVIIKNTYDQNYELDSGIYNRSNLTIYDNVQIIGINYGISNYRGTLTMGANDGTVSTTSPIVDASKGPGVYNNGGTFNFYDGIITGTSAISGNVTNIPTGYMVQKTTASSLQSAILVQANYQNMITNEKYAALNEAFAAVSNNQTIQVLQNVTETTTASLPSGKTGVKLDLNGKTITSNATYAITNNGVLDIFNSSSDEGIITGSNKTITNTGTLTLNGTSSTNVISIKNTGSASNNSIENTTTGTITINSNVNVTSTSSNALKNYNVATILGGNFTGGNNTIDNSGQLTISGGTITAATTRNGIINQQTGTLTINGANVNINGFSTSTGVLNRGILSMSDGRISAVGDGISNACQSGICGNVTMTGGSITASAIGINLGSGNTLTLGTKDGNVSTTTPSVRSTASNGIGIKVATGATFNFYDGIIKGYATSLSGNSISGNVSDIEAGYAVQKTKSSSVETAILVLANYENTSTNIGYLTLGDAFTNVQSNQTIKVLQNATETSIASIASEKTGVKLDLNGKTISYSASQIYITNYGELDIYNSSPTPAIFEGGNGLFSNSDLQGILRNYGTLTINGTSSTNQLTIRNTAVDDSGAVVINNIDGTITLNNNVTVTFTEQNNIGRKLIRNKGTVNINGATLIDTLTVNSSVGISNEDNSNGTINFISGTITTYSAGIKNPSTGTTVMSGGTITASTGAGIYNGGNLTITDGIVNGANYGIYINNANAVVTLGINDGNTPNTNSPQINALGPASVPYGIYSASNATLNFYDGKVTSTYGTGYEIEQDMRGSINTPSGYGVDRYLIAGIGTATLAPANYQNTTTNKQYCVLADAFLGLGSGETIKVINDATESSQYSHSVTANVLDAKLDLNGHTVVLTANTGITNTNKLDIYNGSSTPAVLKGSNVLVSNRGTLTVNGTSSSNSLTIENTSETGKVIDNTGTEVTLNENATLIFSTPTTSNRSIISNRSIVNINGATLSDTLSTGTSSYGIHNESGYSASRTYMSSGSINVYNTAIYNHGGTGTTTPAIEITGGTITSIASNGIQNFNLGTLKMSGGTIIAGKNGIYNNYNGDVIVTGGSVSGSQNGIYIPQGSSITLGEDDGTTSISYPEIISTDTTGIYYGINNNRNITFNFYDGIIKSSNGTGYSIKETVASTPTNYQVFKETISGVENAYLTKIPILMAGSSGTISTNYLRTNIKRQDIESLTFVTSIGNHAVNGTDTFDVSKDNDGSVLAWVTDTDSDGKYEMTIGANGIIYASSGAYLFQNLRYLDSLNGIDNLDTSNVTNMNSMFYYTGLNSTVFTLDLGENFDTSNVTDMSNMFQDTGQNSTVFTLDLGDNFDTSNVTNMNKMFFDTGISSTVFTLDLGENFDTSNVTDMSYMFYFTGYNSQVFTLNLGEKYDTSNVTNMSNMFNSTGYNSKVLILNLGENFDTSNVTDMNYMFHRTGNSNRTFTLDLGDKFDTSNVVDMGFMFFQTGQNSTAFTLDLGENFDTSKVTNMREMFRATGYSSTVFTLDLGEKFDTSSVTDMNSMFYSTGRSSTTFTLDLGEIFDTSKVTNMSYMFHSTGRDSTVFTLDLGEKFDTSNVKDMSYMFYNTGYSSPVFTLDLGEKYDTSKVTNMSYMFFNTGYNSTIFTLDLGKKFDTSNVTNMSYMFYFSGRSNTSFTLDLTQFDTSNVTGMRSMFDGSRYLKTIYVSDTFVTTAVTDSTDMFKACTSLVGGAGTVYDSSHIDASYAHIDGGTSNPGYFTGPGGTLMAGTNGTQTTNYLRTNIKKQDIESLTFANSLSGHTANGTDCFDVSLDEDGSVLAWVTDSNSNGKYEMTIGANGIVHASSGSYLFAYLENLNELNGMNNFDTSSVTDMSSMFLQTAYGSTIFTLDLGNKFDTSMVTNMSNMFYNTGNNSTVFALDLGDKFDTSKVTNMDHMFSGVGYSNTLFTLDLGDKFDTSNVTNMANMFNQAGFKSTVLTLDLGDKFDTSSVKNMSNMFTFLGSRNAAFTLDLGDRFDTSSVINMGGMFNGTGSNSTIFTLDLGDKFDTSKVTNMHDMFVSTGSSSPIFTLDLGDKFDTSNVTDMSYMFESTGSSNPSFTLDLGDKFDTSKVTNMHDMFSQMGSTGFTLNLGDKFDTSNVTDMGYMFYSTGKKSTVFTLDLGDKFDTSNVIDMKLMFYSTGYNSTIFTLDLGDKFDTSSVTDMNHMFDSTGYSSTLFTLDLGDKFDTSNVMDMSSMFYYTGYNSTIFTLDLENNFDTSNVENMTAMFHSTGRSSPVFTLDLGDKFNTSNVTDMSSMFYKTGYSNPTFTLDLNRFDTVKVRNMSNMFYDSRYLKTIYVSDTFVTTAVVSSTNMFNGCTSLVGGSGTTYNNSNVNASYAHIDGGTSNPGYFTRRQ